MMKLNYNWLVAPIAALALVGCNGGSGSGGGTTASGKKTFKIAVIPKGSTHEYWKSIHEGANTAAAELGDVEIEWKGPMLENDRESQIQVVSNFVNAGVNGMVLAPLDDQALVNPVSDATKNDIPVVIIDSSLKGGGFISYIATDNEKGGEIAGQDMVKLLNGKGKIVMLRYAVGSASTDQREQGFMNVIQKTPGIQVLSADQYAGPTTESAAKASENLLSRFKKPDGSLDLDGIYCPNESSTFGMLRVLQDNGWAGKVHFVGFDSSAKLLEGLQKGQIDGLVVQNPRKMGYLGVKTIEAALTKKPYDKQIDTGATLVTKDNMTTPDIAKLIAPPKD